MRLPLDKPVGADYMEVNIKSRISGPPDRRAFFVGGKTRTDTNAMGLKTKTTQDERILEIIEPVAEDLGYRIVRVRLMGGKRATLQIMAERVRDGQMEVDDCATLSRALSTTLEVEDPIHEAYVLEVSSPGLDRPLVRPEDFETYAGYLARIELDRMVEGRKRFRGVLDGFEGGPDGGPNGGSVGLVLDGEEDAAQLPYDWISDAKLLITDELIKAGPQGLSPDTPKSNRPKSNKET